jgi:hypothetical protein
VLLQLQELARDLTGWPARAVEFRPRVAAAATARFPDLGGATTADLRAGDRLDRADGPFADLSRRPDVRRVGSTRTPGRGGLTAVGLFVWRLKVNAVQAGEARLFAPPHPSHHHHHHGEFRTERYHLDPLGLDRPLFTLPAPLPDPTGPAGETEVPGPIRLRALRDHPERYYGRDKSLFLWRVKRPGRHEAPPSAQPGDGDSGIIPAGAVQVHDLADWERSLPPDHPAVAEDSCWEGVVVDPTRSRVLARYKKRDDRKKPDDRVLWAKYHTASPGDIGGGGYFRDVPPVPAGVELFVVGGPPLADADAMKWFPTLSQALAAWAELADGPRRVVIEIRDDATHRVAPPGESFAETVLRAGEHLEVRAAPHRRPVLHHAGPDDEADWTISRPDDSAGPDPEFVLDGVTLARTPLRLEGTFGEVRIRHATLAAGPDADGAIELQSFDGCLSVEGSVVCGTVHVRPETAGAGCDTTTYKTAKPAAPAPILRPLARVVVADSILNGGWDAETGEACGGEDEGASEPVALAGWPTPPGDGDDPGDAVGDHPPGHVALTVLRTTVFGDVNVHALDLAEDSVFAGRLRVSDTARGCVRFCSLRANEPRTPPRHACQPDLAADAFCRARSAAATEDEPAALAAGVLSPAGLAAVNLAAEAGSLAAAEAAAAPRFASTRYGDPAFAQLARDCHRRVSRGASDESEMGAFHDLYNPYREALLQAGVADAAPADADAAIFFVT